MDRLDRLDRNWGATQNSREYWGGNNGFITFIMNVPADTEIGVTATDEGDDAFINHTTFAQRNLTKFVEVVASRGVLVTTSQIRNDVDGVALKAEIEKQSPNVLAFHSIGTLGTTAFAITFEVERANVFDKQTSKPGATYAVDSIPAEEIAKHLTHAGLFETKDGKAADAVDAVVVKVFDALPPII